MRTWAAMWMGLVLGACGGSETTDAPGGETGDPSPTGLPAIGPLLNGDGEDCPTLAPWETDRPDAVEMVTEQNQGSVAPIVYPYEGDCFLSLARAAAGDQRVTVWQSGTAAPGTVVTLTGMFRTSGSDVATFGFGGSAPFVREAQASPETWTPFSISHTVPEGDDAWVVELGADLFTGTGANVFFDALTLTQRDSLPPFRPTCGDGVVDPDEACDEGLANGAGRCTDTCDDAYGDACILVEDDVCTSFTFDPPKGPLIDWVNLCFDNSSPTLDGVAGRERAALCTDVMVCLRETKCTSEGRDLENCFCGDIPWKDCLAHDPPEVRTAAGPCAAEIEAAAGVPQGDDTLGEHLANNRQNVLYAYGNALLLDRCVGSSVQGRLACW